MPVQRLRLHGLRPEDGDRATALLRAIDGVYSAVVDGPGGWADVGLTPAQARIYQRIAWETVKNYRPSGVAAGPLPKAAGSKKK